MKKPNQARRGDGGIDWSRQLRFDIEWAKRCLLETGRVSPMFVIRSRDMMRVVSAVFPDDDAKRRVLLLVRAMCIAFDALGLTFIAEAWARSAAPTPGESKEQLHERLTAMRPSEAEDRIEVVAVQTMYRDAETGERRTMGETREIIRDGHGKPIGLKPQAFPNTAVIEGRMVDLFPPEPPSASDCAIAREVLEKLAEMLGLGMEEISGSLLRTH
jgi:hypothetical protein